MNTPPGSYTGLNRSGSDISAVDSIHMLSRRATAGSSAAPSIIRSELGSISSNVEGDQRESLRGHSLSSVIV
jgi:hypothetical protein